MEVFRGYTLNEPFQNKNAGFSRWTTGRKNGREYFLKEFLNPVYPLDYTLSADIRQQKVNICQEYEKNNQRLLERVNAASDGNVIRVLEFFREGAHYYEVSERVTDVISTQELAKYPMKDRMMVCYLLLHSMARLHREGVVHADVKETNVMLHKTPSGKIIPKLIDFGSSYLEGTLIPEDEGIGGDQLYLSPESFLFILGEGPKPGKEIDVFALGLLMHQYLTGALPQYNTTEYLYPYESVLDDIPLVISDKLSGEIRQLISDMLIKDPTHRMTAGGAERILHSMLFPGVPFEGMGSGGSSGTSNGGTVGGGSVPGGSGSGSGTGSGSGSGKKKMDDFFHMAGDL